MDVAGLHEFARRGFVVAPNVVARDFVELANAAIDRMIEEHPPPTDHRGNHFYWPRLRSDDALARVLFAGGAFATAQSLVAPGLLDAPTQAQISLIIPPYDHRPGSPHIDGITPPEPSGRPGTFTMLAGIMLTDQTSPDTGNLWVWPGTHRSAGSYFRKHGADALMATRGSYPPVDLPEPEQVMGRVGDLLLAHYMLAHNIGGNTSGGVRRMLYFRLMRAGHRARWRECLLDPMLEFEAVRAAIDET